MKKFRRPRFIRLALIACSSMFLGAAATPDAMFQARFSRARDAFVVVQAIEGAARRLEKSECLELLTSFRGTRGKTPAQVLSEDGLTATGHLRRLFFYSGEDGSRCRQGALAFTSPGSRVVYICPARFREAHATNSARAEAVILHEMLHTLGLGEDPPTSAEITARVVAACGG